MKIERLDGETLGYQTILPTDIFKMYLGILIWIIELSKTSKSRGKLGQHISGEPCTD